MKLRGTQDVRVFVLGPPRDPELLKTLDPEGGEEFHSLALSRCVVGQLLCRGGRRPR